MESSGLHEYGGGKGAEYISTDVTAWEEYIAFGKVLHKWRKQAEIEICQSIIYLVLDCLSSASQCESKDKNKDMPCPLLNSWVVNGC